jgi:hypothetical protein
MPSFRLRPTIRIALFSLLFIGSLWSHATLLKADIAQTQIITFDDVPTGTTLTNQDGLTWLNFTVTDDPLFQQATISLSNVAAISPFPPTGTFGTIGSSFTFDSAYFSVSIPDILLIINGTMPAEQ